MDVRQQRCICVVLSPRYETAGHKMHKTHLGDIGKLSAFFPVKIIIGIIYRQKKGFSIGGPLSAIISMFLRPESKPQHPQTADCSCERDNMLEKIKASITQELIDHLNTTDTRNKIYLQGKNIQSHCFLGHENPYIALMQT